MRCLFPRSHWWVLPHHLCPCGGWPSPPWVRAAESHSMGLLGNWKCSRLAGCFCLWVLLQHLDCSWTSHPILVTREWHRQVTRLLWTWGLLKCRTPPPPLPLPPSLFPLHPQLVLGEVSRRNFLSVRRINHSLKVRVGKDLHEHIVKLSLVTGDKEKGSEKWTIYSKSHSRWQRGLDWVSWIPVEPWPERDTGGGGLSQVDPVSFPALSPIHLGPILLSLS